MASPTFSFIQPAAGPSSGGDLVRVVGTHFGDRVRVLLGSTPAVVVLVREERGQRNIEIRTPAHAPGLVSLELTNLDVGGTPIAGESLLVANAYRFERPTIAREADLTRVIRQLLREMKRQVVANVSTSVSVDYDDTADDQSVIAMAKLPSVVLTGPTLRQNRFYSANEPHYDVVGTPTGLQAVRRRPPLTVDLAFGLTVASSRTAELFNLMGSVATFLNRNRWLELPRDPSALDRGSVRWELEADGDFRTQLASRDDLRVFTCGFVVRGFDVDEGLPLDRNPMVERPELETEGL